LGQTRRRNFLLGAGALLAAPLGVYSQPTAILPRIGVQWQTAPPPPVHPQMPLLLKGLNDLGWQDGKTVVIEYRYAGNDAERLAKFAAELVRLKVDVITTSGDLSTRAAQQATTTIPIVMVVGFPVESGFVKSLARPGGNITGVAVLSDDLSAKRLGMLKEFMPQLSRVAVLWDPVTSERQPKAAEAAARSLGVQSQILRAQTPEELAPAFEAAVKARAEALLVLVSPMFLGNRPTFVSLAARHRIPVMYYNPAWVDIGGLITYGFVADEQWRLVADSINKILKGARAADLPVEQPTRFELVINLKTAKELGLTVPQSVLLRADRVIE
jgi:putative ABC transport system substrate-binding protein